MRNIVIPCSPFGRDRRFPLRKRQNDVPVLTAMKSPKQRTMSPDFQ